MSKTIGSLSELGWVESTEAILSKLLGYYILTDSGQSVIFQNRLTSLPYTYHLYINDPTAMAIQVRKDLEKLLGNYYPNVDVETRVKQITDSTFGIVIFAGVIDDDGVRVTMGKVVDMISTGVRKVIDINNYGDGLAALENL